MSARNAGTGALLASLAACLGAGLVGACAPPERAAPGPTAAERSAPSGVTEERELTARTSESGRAWLVSAPRGAPRALPVVLVFHGGGMNGEAMRAYADLERRARGPALFVYPSALVRKVWADEYALHWDAAEDLALVDLVLRELVDSGRADRSRVYALGLSSGAYFANQLACARGSALRAFAALEGGGPFGDCKGPVSALVVHDRADPVVPAPEGQASLERWLAEDRCAADVVPLAPEATDGIACSMHAKCAAGTRVASCAPRHGVHALQPGVREAALRFFGL